MRKTRQTGLGSFDKELFLGSKVFAIFWFFVNTRPHKHKDRTKEDFWYPPCIGP